MAITAKPSTYNVDTAHAHCPDHLWMMDEASGTSLTDRGKTAGYDLTFGATTGTGPDWTTDATHGPILNFVLANADFAEADFTAGLSGTHVIGVITKPTTGTTARVAASVCDSSQIDRYALLTWRADEKLEVSSRFDDTQSNSATTGTASGGWDLFLIRFSDTKLDWSLNGSAWATNTVTRTGLVASLNRFTLGARRTTSPGAYYNDPMCAAMWWKADKDPADLYALFTGASWSFLTSGTKYVKVLTQPTAASASGVEGVVLNATRDTVIGEFTGQTFEAALESGSAVLLVPVDSILPNGATLTTSDTPLVSAYNTTNGTVGLVSATVVEV